MFFVRAAFWIFLILFLMPTSEKERSDFYIAAGRTVSDLGSFCTRNPDVCDKTGAMYETVARKVRSTVRQIEDAISRDAEADGERHPGYTTRERSIDPRGQRGALSDPNLAPARDGRQNTLRPEDLAPGWRGPGPGGV